MLSLTRKIGETITIGGKLVVQVTRTQPHYDRAWISVSKPPDGEAYSYAVSSDSKLSFDEGKVKVSVTEIRGSQVRFMIDAPREIRVR